MACKDCGYFQAKCGLCGVGKCDERDELVEGSDSCPIDSSKEDEQAED